MANILSGYQRAFAKHGESPLALQWTSYRSAAKRYRNLVRDIELEGKTILDAGCGMGDLVPYLFANSADFKYLGVDINPDFIDIARKRYAGQEFAIADPFGGDIKSRFDVVLSCGVLNHNEPDWQQRRKEMIKSLFELANETLAFNMAGSIGSPSQSTGKIAYARAEEFLDFCASLTTKVSLRADYHPDDFTIVMKK